MPELVVGICTDGRNLIFPFLPDPDINALSNAAEPGNVCLSEAEEVKKMLEDILLTTLVIELPVNVADIDVEGNKTARDILRCEDVLLCDTGNPATDIRFNSLFCTNSLKLLGVVMLLQL